MADTDEEMFNPQEVESQRSMAEAFDDEIRAYVLARMKCESAEAIAKAAKEELKKQEIDLVDFLEAAGVKTANHDLGRFTRTNRTIASVKDKEALSLWIEEAGLRNTLLDTRVKQKELNEVVKERLEEGDDVPDGVEPLTIRSITFTRKK